MNEAELKTNTMSGWLGDLSAKQQTALRELRTRVQADLQPSHDDRYLLRWLRARSFDVGKAEQMLRNHLKWRKQMGVDTILDTFKPPEVLVKYYPGGLHGYDKEGSPIYIENLGYADIKGIMRSVKRSDIIKYKICSCERNWQSICSQTEKLGRECRGLVIICDMQHYGLKHLWKPAIEVYNEVLTIFEAHYPETLKRTYVINAHMMFPVFYNLVKPFLNEETKNKVVVLGGNWKERLMQDIDADQLPEHWGGTADNKTSKVCMGGEVPRQYYINDDTIDTSGFTSVTVNRGSQLQVPVDVPRQGSVIRWQFQTNSKDIKFSLYRRSCEGQSLKDMEQLLPLQKVHSDMVLEDGSFNCQQPGSSEANFVQVEVGEPEGLDQVKGPGLKLCDLCFNSLAVPSQD